MNEQQSTSGVGGSTGTDFQPSTQNPQGNVNTNVQSTSSGLQASGSSILDPGNNILVPTANGTITVTPTTSTAPASQAPASKHPSTVVWIGIGLVVLMLVVMAYGLLRPRKY